jgi:hypothetical protein
MDTGSTLNVTAWLRSLDLEPAGLASLRATTVKMRVSPACRHTWEASPRPCPVWPGGAKRRKMQGGRWWPWRDSNGLKSVPWLVW